MLSGGTFDHFIVLIDRFNRYQNLSNKSLYFWVFRSRPLFKPHSKHYSLINTAINSITSFQKYAVSADWCLRYKIHLLYNLSISTAAYPTGQEVFALENALNNTALGSKNKYQKKNLLKQIFFYNKRNLFTRRVFCIASLHLYYFIINT